MEKDPFKEYILQKEPQKKELGLAWYTAIGLQKVDGLDTSKYLNELAQKNIEGDISTDKVEELITSYYIENKEHSIKEEEADKVSVNITKVLSDKSFVFQVSQYIDIHKKLFHNVYKHAGKIRDYNITKNEWVLNGDTVMYGGASLIRESLEYDFNAERNFDYSKINKNEFISHIARFIANLWQIHAFCEGNTRTTAVFLIKYLRKFGYDVTNAIFAENAWYFRNSLVRANYTNVDKEIFETTEYLELFLKNLILNEDNDLKNRYLHIDWKEKVDIDTKKVDIDDEKVDIQNIGLTSKLKENVIKLYNPLKKLECISRKDVVDILKISPSGASGLISKLLKYKILVPVKNKGKGKYKFNIKEI